MIALVLMAGMASILFGSLSLAARSWDGGEAKVLQVSDMRSAQTYLRAQIAAQYPQRLWKAAELPLLFAGRARRDALRRRAARAGGGRRRLLFPARRRAQRREVAAGAGTRDPRSRGAAGARVPRRRALRAGRRTSRSSPSDTSAATRMPRDADEPTWRDRWDDRQRLPLLVRIDVKPARVSPGRRSSSSRAARRRRAARPGTRERAVARGRAFEPFACSASRRRAFGPPPPSAASP